MARAMRRPRESDEQAASATTQGGRDDQRSAHGERIADTRPVLQPHAGKPARSIGGLSQVAHSAACRRSVTPRSK